MSYANAKAVPFVAIVGENEMNEGKVTLKNMATGEQSLLTPDEMINIIKKLSFGVQLNGLCCYFIVKQQRPFFITFKERRCL